SRAPGDFHDFSAALFRAPDIHRLRIDAAKIRSACAQSGLDYFYGDPRAGGMTAVIWTDVIQMGMYVIGALVSFFILVGKIPGGFSHAWDVASAAGKLQVFDFH